MRDQQDGRFDKADRHIAACLRSARAAGAFMMLFSSAPNLAIDLDRDIEGRDYAAVDRDMRRARQTMNQELGPESNECYDFGML